MRVSFDEYLRTTYGSPTEYVAGEAVTKDGSPVTVLGIGIEPEDSFEHGNVVGLIGSWFMASKDDWNARAVMLPKIEVLPNVFRMPDLALLRRGPGAEEDPPLLAVEVISNEGSSIMAEIVDEYLNAGIATVWMIDPRTRTARWCTKEGWFKVLSHGRLQVPGSSIHLDLESVIPGWHAHAPLGD